jgi:cytochrome c5
VWSSRRLVLAALVAMVALVALAALVRPTGSAGDGKSSRRSIYAEQFPAGDGRPLADRYCQICHSATLVTQQAKDSTGWEKTLVQMEKWGATMAPAEHDTLRRYLLAHYGPRAR